MATVQLHPPSGTRLFVTSKGDRVESNLTDTEAVAILQDIAAGNFPGTASSREFAACMANSWRKRGLSVLQLPYAHKLATEALAAKAAENPTPRREQIEIGSFAPIAALFKKAAEKIQYPKIRLQLPDEEEILLYPAGSRAKVPGSITVVSVSRRRDDGERVWYGRILPDTGAYEVGAKSDAVIKLLKSFAANPAKVASDYGRMSGSCCFCQREITTDESLAVGYGPICAERYGLPWGRQ